jgi:hypothetical protein
MSDVRLVDGLNEAIRENPLAAVLVGAGVFWMLFGSKVPAAASALSGAANAAGQTFADTGQTIVDAAGSAVADVSTRASSMAESVASTAREAVRKANTGSEETVGATNEGLSKAWDASVETTSRFASETQQRLSESLERQPLLLGALGLAVGAAIASAIPRTAVEDEWMGSEASAVRDRLGHLAGDAKNFAMERGRAVLDDVTQEAQKQGLSPQGVRSGAQDAASRVKTVAGAVRESVSSRIS